MYLVIFGGEYLFKAVLTIDIPFFILSIILSIAVIFSLGLVIAALAPSQTAASALGGVFFFVLLFLAGLWINPAQVGEPYRSIMYYSPSGAATKLMLYSVYNKPLPFDTIITAVVYAIIFSLIAIRYFRWE